MLPHDVSYHYYDQPCEFVDDCCEDCMTHCSDSHVDFHPGASCEAEHKRTCNNRGRAQRKVFNAKVTVQEKESELRGVKRKLEELEEEFCHARISLAQARISERKLYKL
mmetsp:Transcript_5269/g.7749  ORF Transcript_5269/g.7749 Transcript_5269/m.7749 type:complete len:109 (-) Transcript_5269:100-426(-)